MTIEIRTESVTSHDGHTFDAPLVLPAVTPAPGIVLVHEIFGVNDYITGVAERLARLGYAVLAPDLFARIDPNNPLDHSEEGLGLAFERVGQLDIEEAVKDADAALAHVSRLDECNGTAGILGFCLGGTIAFAVALRSEPDAAVSYYGSGVADLLVDADEAHCPMKFVYGGSDPFIPREQVDACVARFADRDDVEVEIFADSGHAFDNYLAPQFFDPPAATAAWGLTADFLRRTLGTP